MWVRATFNRLVLSTILVVCLLATMAAKAISITDIHFTELTRKDGLSSLTIVDIVEDKHGFLWFATTNGLNRYDGYSVKQYHPSDANPNSLPPGLITQLFISSAGNIWIGTREGLAKYNESSDDFTNYNSTNSSLKHNEILTIAESSDNNLLIADRNNLYEYSNETETLSRLAFNAKFPEQISVIRDEPNRIWIGTFGNGAYIYDKKKKVLYPLDKVNPWNIHVGEKWISDLKVIAGEYWLIANSSISRISADGEHIQHINGDSHPIFSSSNINTVSQVNESVWIGTQNGLVVYSLENDELFTLSAENGEMTGLTHPYALSIYNDSTGATWVGTFLGLFKYHPKLNLQRFYTNKKDFQQGNSVWGLEEDLNGQLWFVTQENGIARFNEQEGTYTYHLSDTNTSFWDLAIDRHNQFWIATSKGISQYSVKNDSLVEQYNFLPNVFVDSFLFDGEKIWSWIEQEGLVSIDTNPLANRNSRVSMYLEDDRKSRKQPIFIDSESRLWLSSEKEIHLFDTVNKTIKRTITPDDGLNSRAIAVYDWGGHYWLTTISNGVVKVDKRTLKVTDKESDEIQGGVIYSSIGRDNSIWYANTQGIQEIILPNLDKGEVVTLEQLNYNALNEDAVLLTADNRLFFGGETGFTQLTESYSFAGNNQGGKARPPEILDIEIFGSGTDTSGSQLISSPIYLLDAVSIAYNASINLTFGQINPIRSTLLEYRWRLNGFENDWQSPRSIASKLRIAAYSGLNFGNYVFEVQVKAPGQQWSNSKELKIMVDRPPWLHNAALVFYLIALLFTSIYIVRQWQIRKANQLKVSESEERLKLTLWSSGDELWDWDVYKGQVFRSNTWGTLDFPQDNIRAHSAYDANIHPSDIIRVQEALQAHLNDETEYYELTYRAKTFKNKWIWILDRGKVVKRDHNNQPVRMTGTLKNIHHLKQAEEQLNLFKRSIENISEGVFITDTNFKFISVNTAYCKYTGETRNQALASYMYFHQYPEAFTEEIKKTLKTKGNWFGEVESVRVNGERYEIELNLDAVHDEDGKISHFVGVFSDITSRKSTEKELLKLANTDPLTELPNRSFFQASHHNLVRRTEPHALLCLDMDNFKKINDSLGHQTGDILIKQIAKRLQRITGNDATCYRLGGDEFSVLMEDTSDIHTITHYAQSVLDSLSRPFIINKQEFVLGASIGIAFYPDDGNTPQEILKNADTAMYFAKNNGGNSYQFFSGEMNQNAVRQLQIENLIRQGIKDDLFTVYYQPKVDITTGKLVSMEALVRFEHPHKGIVSPGQFIPLAEQTGQIIDIGEIVLRKAIADTKRWVTAGIFSGRVAVNISAKQFELPDLDDRINRVLNEIGLSPLHLECEITEGTLMENPDQGLEMMERLRERGIHLALDDFGTGYSSLAYLKRFPLNTLKIDKAFIDDIAESSVDRHMAAAIINIAHNLGLKVVAEGVEEEKQLTILRRYECEMIQGYLYSKPLNAERFEKLLKENQKLHHLIGQPSV
ncbi:EAL domain-containing protein [Alteromonas sp. ASW11-130]|uniref:EAL domain-containing protein n=1 Tax=Alteromonas sp. ASW11-130 TaxID=3015775 RepID=UPI002241DA4B|nr:EAL domain-containing protein [Alteromonas sp. ASW11-130]MCW8093042.1 EAL domain-containing protein [Alteromonas sp. ASW11-130]